MTQPLTRPDATGEGLHGLLPAPRAESALPAPPEHDRYTLRRFARESAIAMGILAVGLPLVLTVTGREPSKAPAALPAAPEVLPRVAPTEPVLVLSGASLQGDGLVDLLGQGGTAVSEPGAGWAAGSVSLTTLVAERDWEPDQAMVVVQGGEADVALGPERVELAAAQLADRLRAKFRPTTDLVFVGPAGDAADPSLGAVRDAVRRAAAQKSVHFVDPLERGWTVGDPGMSNGLAEAVRAYLTN